MSFEVRKYLQPGDCNDQRGQTLTRLVRAHCVNIRSIHHRSRSNKCIHKLKDRRHTVLVICRKSPPALSLSCILPVQYKLWFTECCHLRSEANFWDTSFLRPPSAFAVMFAPVCGHVATTNQPSSSSSYSAGQTGGYKNKPSMRCLRPRIGARRWWRFSILLPVSIPWCIILGDAIKHYWPGSIKDRRYYTGVVWIGFPCVREWAAIGNGKRIW